MRIPEFTLSPELSARLVTAFAPLVAQQVEGDPLVSWLQARMAEPERSLPEPIRQGMIAQLDRLMLQEGGEEGIHIRETMEEIIREDGVPAMLIHGLPHGDAHEEVAAVIAEAFRQWMGNDPAYNYRHFVGIDVHRTINTAPEQYAAAGNRNLHHDSADYVLLQGIDEGANPRSTEIFDAPEFIGHLVDLVKEKLILDPADCARLSQRFLHFLQLPIWPAQDEPARAKAKEIGKLAHRSFGPILYRNPHFQNQPDSCEYRFLTVPFNAIHKRVRDMSAAGVAEIPPGWRDDLDLLKTALHRAVHTDIATRSGPILKPGDLLVANNALTIHAGGPFQHPVLPPETPVQSRRLRALDVVRSSQPYPPLESDSWASSLTDGIVPTDTLRIR